MADQENQQQSQGRMIRQASNESLFQGITSLLQVAGSENRRRLELYIGTDREKLDEYRPPCPFYPSDVPFSQQLAPEEVSVPADAIYLPSLSLEQARRLGALFPSLTTLWIVVDGNCKRRQVNNFWAVQELLWLLSQSLVVLRLCDISMWPPSERGQERPKNFFKYIMKGINEMANLKELSLSNAGICFSAEENGLLLDLLLSRVKVLRIQSDHPETVGQLARSLLKRYSLSDVDGSRLPLPAIYLKSNHLEISKLRLINPLVRQAIKEIAIRPTSELAQLTILSTFSGVKCLYLFPNCTFPWSNLCKELSSLEQLEHLSLTSYNFLVDVTEWADFQSFPVHYCSCLKSIELVVDRVPMAGTQMTSFLGLLQALAPALQVLKLVVHGDCLSDHDLQQLLFPLHKAPHLCYVIYYCDEKEKVFSKTQLEAASSIRP